MTQNEFSKVDFDKLLQYFQEKVRENEGDNGLIFSKFYGDSDVVITAVDHLNFRLAKDVPRFARWVDYGLVYHYAKVEFNLENNTISISYHLKKYVILMCAAVLLFVTSQIFDQPQDSYMHLAFGLTAIVYVLLQKAKFKKFVPLHFNAVIADYKP